MDSQMMTKQQLSPKPYGTTISRVQALLGLSGTPFWMELIWILRVGLHRTQHFYASSDLFPGLMIPARREWFLLMRPRDSVLLQILHLRGAAMCFSLECPPCPSLKGQLICSVSMQDSALGATLNAADFDMVYIQFCM